MKKIVKMFVSAILTLAISISYICLPVHASVVIDEDRYREAENALYDLGILAGYRTNTIQIDKKLTRIEFLKLIMKLYGNYAVANEENVFSDVTADSEDSAVADAAYSMGVISGFNNKLLPSDNISYYDAVVIAVRALGYSAIGEYMKYPQDYLSVAGTADLLDNIANRGDEFSAADAYVLIYNTIRADMFVQTGYGKENTFAREEGTTILTKYQNIHYIEGQVTKTPISSLFSYGHSSFGIEITPKSGEAIEGICGHEYNDLLGMYVRGFYKDNNGTYEILSVAHANEKLDITEIVKEDLQAIDPSTLEVSFWKNKSNDETKNDREVLKKIKIPGSANWIFNNQYAEGIQENVIAKINDSLSTLDYDLNLEKIQLIDFNNDKKIDLVKVDMYKVFVVDYIGSRGIEVDWISSNPNSPNLGQGYTERYNLAYNAIVTDYNGKYELDLTDTSKFFYVHTDDETIDITDVKKYSVLSIKEGLSTAFPYVDITVTNNTLTDKIKMKKDNKFILSNDEEISVANNSTVGSNIFNNLNLGGTYTYLLDHCGRVAGYTTVSIAEDEVILGYVLKVRYNENDDLNELSIYNPDSGEDGYAGIKTYKTVERVILNGEKQGRYTDLTQRIQNGTLVRYKLDTEGNVKSIETPGGASGEGSLDYVLDDSVREAFGNNKRKYKVSSHIFYAENTEGSVLEANLAIDEETIIMKAPKIVSDESAWETCTVLRMQDMMNGYNERGLSVEGFVFDNKTLICDVVIIYTEDAMNYRMFLNNDPILVDKVITVLNEYDEPVVSIRGCDSEGPRYFNFQDDTVRTITGFNSIQGLGGDYKTARIEVADIHPGDVILPDYDDMGRIRACMILYSHSGQSQAVTDKRLFTGDYAYNSMVGKVQKVEYPFMSFRENGKSDECILPIYREAGSQVIIYDEATKAAKLGNHNDIVPRNENIYILTIAGQRTFAYLFID